MTPRRILLTAMTILLLLSTFAFAKPDSANTRNDTVAIEVLEERVRGNAEKTQNQVVALQDLLKAQNDAINQRVTDLNEASNRQIGNILWMTGFFLTLSIAVVTFFGHRAISGWIKQSISKRTEKLITQHKAELLAQGKEATAAFILELEKDAKEAREEWAKAVKAREEYESSKKRMEKKAKEISSLKRPPVEPGEKTPEFQKMLEAVKDEADYTATDWYVLGDEAFRRGDWKAAVVRYSNSITINPNDYWSHFSRALALGEQRLHDEALKSYDTALEIKPEDMSALQNAAEANILLGHYDVARQRASKALDLSKDRDTKATSLYVKCIAEKLLGEEPSATETEFEQILKEDFKVDWSFGEIEGWLEKADISDEALEFIKAKTAMLKKKTKKK